jgi:hypothetical protein
MVEQAANPKQPAAPKERIHGNIQSFFYTLLRVLPPTELSRFRPQRSKIYNLEGNQGLGFVINPRILLRKLYNYASKQTVSMKQPIELKWPIDSEKRYIYVSYCLLYDQHNYEASVAECVSIIFRAKLYYKELLMLLHRLSALISLKAVYSMLELSAEDDGDPAGWLTRTFRSKLCN